MLQNEVLPAPLGPTSETNSPSSMVKLTSSTACVSPKYFLRWIVSSRLMASPREPADKPGRRPHDPGRQDQDQGHEHDAEQQLPVFRARDRGGLEIVEGHRTDDGPGERAETAQHAHEHDLAGERPVEHIGRGQPVERHPEDAGEPRERARYDEGDPAGASHRDADEAGARLVVTDRLQRLAEWRVHDDPHDYGR